jgi:AcrR family transcriptional regulator
MIHEVYMARTVNEAERAMKRNQILDVTQRLIYRRGYEQMSIQEILDELGISKGAFYHYFDSKPALLEAVIERMLQEALTHLRPIADDPRLPALEKLQRFFDVAAQWKTARKALLLEFVRAWYADHNAIVRHKWLAMMNRSAIPILVQIFNQGVREGVLDVRYPDQVGSVFLALMQGFGDAFAELILVDELRGDEKQRAERLGLAYNDAIERLLGAPPGALTLLDPAILAEWFDALDEQQSDGLEVPDARTR